MSNVGGGFGGEIPVTPETAGPAGKPDRLRRIFSLSRNAAGVDAAKRVLALGSDAAGSLKDRGMQAIQDAATGVVSASNAVKDKAVAVRDAAIPAVKEMGDRAQDAAASMAANTHELTEAASQIAANVRQDAQAIAALEVLKSELPRLGLDIATLVVEAGGVPGSQIAKLLEKSPKAARAFLLLQEHLPQAVAVAKGAGLVTTDKSTDASHNTPGLMTMVIGLLVPSQVHAVQSALGVVERAQPVAGALQTIAVTITREVQAAQGSHRLTDAVATFGEKLPVAA